MLIAEGLWARKRQGVGHRQRRNRKAHFGELVDIDGSTIQRRRTAAAAHVVSWSENRPETDFHTPVPPGLDLDEVFRLETAHALNNDWVVRHDNRYFQVKRQSRNAPAKSTVLLCEYEDGRLAIEYRGQKLAFEEIEAPPPAAASRPAVPPPKRSSPLRAEHPWRRPHGDVPERLPWPTKRREGSGNVSGVDAPRTSVHPTLRISQRAPDSHIPMSP